MRKATSVIGDRFGFLTISNEIEKVNKQRVVVCLCDCGLVKTVLLPNLRAGHTKSCGCIQKAAVKASNSTHGLSASREHISWASMKARCSDSSRPDYGHYGGRGISFCKEWTRFEAFLADMGERPKGTSLDRIDVNGNYEPSNCRWATAEQQANNKRVNRIIDINGGSQTLAQACASKNLNYKTVHQRLRRGWTIEKALSTISQSTS